MKKPALLFILLLSIFYVNAQSDVDPSLELGIVFSPRIDSQNDFAFDGFGVEAGCYLLKRFGKRGMLSADLRMAYGQRNGDYNNVIDFSNFSFFQDSIVTSRTGMVKHNNLSASIPIKYRFQVSQKVPIHFLVGNSININLTNNTTWKYSIKEYDTVNNVTVSEQGGFEDELEQKTFSSDVIGGVGYKKNNLMLDVYFSGGSISFDHDFIGGMDRVSIVMSVYYRLN